MRIVVTGAKGGTGRTIVRVLRDAGHQVIGVDIQPPTTGETHYVQLDLRDAGGVNDVVADADGIVHFGSLPSDGWTSTTETFHNLMLGGFNILQASRNAGVKRIVMASSIMVYGDMARQPSFPVLETSPLLPFSIYGGTKRWLEEVAMDYSRWHGLAIAALRLGRIVYEGGYDWRLKPHVESDGSAAPVLWTYVDARDVATACLAWLTSNRNGFEAYHIAAPNVCVATPTRALVERFYPQMVAFADDLPEHGSPFSTKKIGDHLGWRALIDWRELRREYEQDVHVRRSSGT